jgi:hypothetical protein
MNLTEEHKAIISSYLRSLLAGAVATYSATQDPTATLNAVWAAVIPTAIRYLNKNDESFGRGA